MDTKILLLRKKKVKFVPNDKNKKNIFKLVKMMIIERIESANMKSSPEDYKYKKTKQRRNTKEVDKYS